MRLNTLSVIFGSARSRSLAGLALALLILPVLLGIAACLKTPVGDPERSRVDSHFTGVWLSADRGAPASKVTIWMLERYDARTWLITSLDVKPAVNPPASAAEPAAHAPDSTEPPPAPSPLEDVVVVDPQKQSCDVMPALADLHARRPNTVSVALYKAWLTTLGGQGFLVLEPKARPSGEQGFRPDHWWLLRAQLREGRLFLSSVKTEVEQLDTISARGKAEEIIARHAAEANFYDRPTEFVPVPRASYNCIRAILTDAGFELRI